MNTIQKSRFDLLSKFLKEIYIHTSVKKFVLEVLEKEIQDGITTKDYDEKEIERQVISFIEHEVLKLDNAKDRIRRISS